MIKVTGAAISRKTSIGGLVESFIDSNVDDLSLNTIELLESLAEEVDTAAGELLQEKFDLNDKVAQLENRVEELE